MDQPDDLLQVVAQTLAGEDGCCCLWDIDGRCCMTGNARRVFDMIEQRTGLSLRWFENVARIHGSQPDDLAKTDPA